MGILIQLNLIIIVNVIYFGECLHYDNQTTDILCSTQCRAVCLENESDCGYGCSPPFKLWMTECDLQNPACPGSCSARIKHFNVTLLPEVPTIYVESITGTQVVLQWIQPYSHGKVLYVLQMRKVGDDTWTTIAYEIQSTRYIMELQDTCHSYRFRVMAINMYGSKGFSDWTYATLNQFLPGSVPNIGIVGGSVIYYPRSEEFMAVIQWDDLQNWPSADVTVYRWNTMPHFSCGQSMTSILPIFEEVNVNQTHQTHHKILFRVNKAAYGCRYDNQVRAITKCNRPGPWTNFTVDLTDCHKIKNFPCEAISTPFRAPGNAVNISLCVLYQEPNIMIRMSWEPPVEQGTAGVSQYIIRWGKVSLNPFPKLPVFINKPNVTNVESIVREIDVPINYNDQSSIYGFQVVPVSLNQHLNDDEWGLYDYNTIKVSGSDDSQKGTVLLDESGLKVVQIQNALAVDVSLQPLTRAGWSVHPTVQRRCSDSQRHAVQYGRINGRSASSLTEPQMQYIPANVSSFELPILETDNEVQYGIKVTHVLWNESLSDLSWEDVPLHTFKVPSRKAYKRRQIEYIVGFVVAGVLIIFIVTSLVVCKTVRQRKKFRHLERQAGEEESNPYYHVHRAFGPRSSVTPAIVADRWEIPHSCVKVGRVLGHGAFGLVLKGRVEKGMIQNINFPKEAIVSGSHISVALKVLQENVQDQYKCDFLKEIRLMKDIGCHKNIVSMLGCCTLREPICLIVEHVPHGDLLSYLQNIRRDIQQRDQSQESYVNRDVDLLSPTDLLSFARQVAVGMEFLSQKGFVHRDLAARNILVGYNKTVKIGDFGLTRFIYNDAVYVNRKGGKLPLKWMSIEAIFHLTFSVASDVWSFGVVLFEMVTLGGTPYPGINTHDILPKLRQGYRMEKPDNCSKELYDVMLSCWQEIPEQRPSFTDLHSILEEMLQECSKSEYLSFKIDVNHGYYTINSNDMDEDVDHFPSIDINQKCSSTNGSAEDVAVMNDSDTLTDTAKEETSLKHYEDSRGNNTVSHHGQDQTVKYSCQNCDDSEMAITGQTDNPNNQRQTQPLWTSSVCSEVSSSCDGDSVEPANVTFDVEVEKATDKCKTDSEMFLGSTKAGSRSDLMLPSREWSQESIFGNLFSSLNRLQRDSGVDSGSSNDDVSLASSSPKTMYSGGSKQNSLCNVEDDVFVTDNLSLDTSTQDFKRSRFVFPLNSEKMSLEVCNMCKYSHKLQKMHDSGERIQIHCFRGNVTQKYENRREVVKKEVSTHL